MADVEKDLYILFIWGDVDISLRGPYETEETRTQAAVDFRKEEGDQHGLYRLDVDKGTKPDVFNFGGGEVEPDENEDEGKYCATCDETATYDPLIIICPKCYNPIPSEKVAPK